MKDEAQCVIIGGGAHGLATAYYLSKLGVEDIAVLEAQYIGYGGSGRNTAILRSNYRTEEGVRFYDQSLALYDRLAEELDYNVMFSRQGHFTLGHTEASIQSLTTRAEVNRALGVNSFMVTPPEIKKMLPDIDVSDHPRFPILGALYHPPGGIIRLAVMREKSWLVITISDQGPGLPEDRLEAIFDRFYSERPRGEKFGTHSGLGLSISRQIVEAHGGTIRAENRRDDQSRIIGASFTVSLPTE